MTKVKVELEGIKEFEKLVGQVAPKEAKKAIRKSLREAGKYVKAVAKRNAPVDTGLLRRKIKVRAATARNGVKMKRGVAGIIVVSGLPGKGGNTGDAYYGYFLELGTKERQKASGQKTGRIKKGEHKFLAPSLYRNKAKVRKFFMRNLRNRIRSMAK